MLSPRTSVLICVLMDSHRHHVCVLTDTHKHERTATDVLCVLTDSHGHPVCAGGHPQTSSIDVQCVLTDTHGHPVFADGHPRTPRGPKLPKQSTGRASMLNPRTNVLICVLIDSHGRPVCANRHTQTHTDSLGRPPQTSCVCWQTPTDVLCVLNRQPTAKITRTVHGKGQRAESKDQRADMCTNGQPQTSCVCADGHTQTRTDSHIRPVC
ncbi:unnamed protein product [Brassica rapa subsp. narinosa]